MEDCCVTVHITTLVYLNTGTVHVLKDGAHVKNVGRYSLEKYLKVLILFFTVYSIIMHGSLQCCGSGSGIRDWVPF
jgi:hypothetical protein